MLAVALAGQLRVLQNHLYKLRARMQELFAKHRDHALFGCLPGTGKKLASWLPAELVDNHDRLDSYQSWQCYVGTAQVSAQRGPVE